MNKLKIAIIGCGRISKNHFESIKKFENYAEITCCCDPIEDRAKEKAIEYGIKKYYTSYQELLDKEKLDLVCICTPSGLHPEHGIMAAEKKINVLVEKPMAINIKSANKLIKACDHNQVQLFVVKQNRLNTTMQLLSKAIEKGRFGKIFMVQSNVFWQRPQSYYDSAKWRGTWEFDGGAFMNQASHYVDAMQWLFGHIETVTAETATMKRKIESEDTGCAIFKFRNGIIGSMNVTMLTYPKNFEGSITVLGEKGTVKIGGVAINHIEKWDFEDYDDDDKFITDCNYVPPSVYGFGHEPYYKNVLETLLGLTEAHTDGREGKRAVEIVEAIYMSARLGKKVSLPLSV
jgi:UDP-N-acetyl-2-amino-2-deoxyglucuronate dehydrogenase